MTIGRGHLLVVDDERLNRIVLTRALTEQGYTVETAENGDQALSLLNRQQPAFDVVLLDVLMPELDGYQTLARIKADGVLAHVPVIMISALDDLDSVIRCIKLGATDYLPKPFNAALLQARISASLAGKRLRDLELEYLEQVGRVTAAVEGGTFAPTGLDDVAARADALGQLARVFQRMAREVRAREERLQRAVHELRIEIDQVRQSEKVAEITESEYFQRLRAQANDLRQIMDGRGEL
jgi:two-component system cell cycle response regulator